MFYSNEFHEKTKTSNKIRHSNLGVLEVHFQGALWVFPYWRSVTRGLHLGYKFIYIFHWLFPHTYYMVDVRGYERFGVRPPYCKPHPRRGTDGNSSGGCGGCCRAWRGNWSVEKCCDSTPGSSSPAARGRHHHDHHKTWCQGKVRIIRRAIQTNAHLMTFITEILVQRSLHLIFIIPNALLLLFQMCAPLKKSMFHLAWSPDTLPTCDAISPLLEYLDTHLLALNAALLPRNFERVLSTVWDVCLLQLGHQMDGAYFHTFPNSGSQRFLNYSIIACAFCRKCGR